MRITFSRVFGATRPRPLSACETVVIDKPAASEISRMLIGAILALYHGAAPPEPYGCEDVGCKAPTDLTKPNRFAIITAMPENPRRREQIVPEYSENAKVALTNFWAWNERDFDRGIQAVSDDFVCVEVASGETYTGHTGLRDEYEKWATALSDGKCEVKNVIDDGEWIVVETIVSGVHDGMLPTPEGDVPPTGRQLAFEMCTVHHIQNGKEDLRRHYFDIQSMMRQLGRS